MVRFKATATAGGKSTKAANAMGVDKKIEEYGTKIHALTSAKPIELNDGDEIPSVEMFARAREEARRKEKEEKLNHLLIGEEPPAKKRKSSTATKSRLKSKLQNFSYKQGEGCHHCKRTVDDGFENELVKCDTCSTLYCERCLLEKYELVRQVFIKKSKKNDDDEEEPAEEKGSDKDSDSDQKEPTDEPQDTKWKCPKCQKLCCCPTCRRKRGLKPVIVNLRKFKLQIAGKFDSFYEYFVYERDHPELGKMNITATKAKKFSVDDSDDEI